MLRPAFAIRIHRIQHESGVLLIPEIAGAERGVSRRLLECAQQVLGERKPREDVAHGHPAVGKVEVPLDHSFTPACATRLRMPTTPSRSTVQTRRVSLKPSPSCFF